MSNDVLRPVRNLCHLLAAISSIWLEYSCNSRPIRKTIDNWSRHRPTMLDIRLIHLYRPGAEVKLMSNTRRQALQAAGLAHPRPDAVTAPLFDSGDPFFFAMDKVQVKYEMLRAHFGDGDTVT